MLLVLRICCSVICYQALGIFVISQLTGCLLTLPGTDGARIYQFSMGLCIVVVSRREIIEEL